MKQENLYQSAEARPMNHSPDTLENKGTPAGANTGFDPASLWQRVNGDMELLRELVEIFGLECPGMLFQIEAAIAEGSAAEVQKVSHKLKGSLLQFSAEDTARLAEALEQMGKTNSLGDAAQTFELLKRKMTPLMNGLRLMVYRSTTQ